MRDIWIRKSWLRIGTGLIALAIIVAIWINYRLELSGQAPPADRPATEGKSGHLVAPPSLAVV
ncbi:MAG: hypothetical protein ACJ8DY_14460 [Xanthobacteraceae bacterium]